MKYSFDLTGVSSKLFCLVLAILCLVAEISARQKKGFRGGEKSYGIKVEASSIGTNLQYKLPEAKVKSSAPADWLVENDNAQMVYALNSPKFATVYTTNPKFNVKGQWPGYTTKFKTPKDVTVGSKRTKLARDKTFDVSGFGSGSSSGRDGDILESSGKGRAEIEGVEEMSGEGNRTEDMKTEVSSETSGEVSGDASKNSNSLSLDEKVSGSGFGSGEVVHLFSGSKLLIKVDKPTTVTKREKKKPKHDVKGRAKSEVGKPEELQGQKNTKREKVKDGTNGISLESIKRAVKEIKHLDLKNPTDSKALKKIISHAKDVIEEAKIVWRDVASVVTSVRDLVQSKYEQELASEHGKDRKKKARRIFMTLPDEGEELQRSALKAREEAQTAARQADFAAKKAQAASKAARRFANNAWRVAMVTKNSAMSRSKVTAEKVVQKDLKTESRKLVKQVKAVTDHKKLPVEKNFLHEKKFTGKNVNSQVEKSMDVRQAKKIPDEKDQRGNKIPNEAKSRPDVNKDDTKGKDEKNADDKKKTVMAKIQYKKNNPDVGNFQDEKTGQAAKGKSNIKKFDSNKDQENKETSKALKDGHDRKTKGKMNLKDENPKEKKMSQNDKNSTKEKVRYDKMKEQKHKVNIEQKFPDEKNFSNDEKIPGDEKNYYTKKIKGAATEKALANTKNPDDKAKISAAKELLRTVLQDEKNKKGRGVEREAQLASEAARLANKDALSVEEMERLVNTKMKRMRALQNKLTKRHEDKALTEAENKNIEQAEDTNQVVKSAESRTDGKSTRIVKSSDDVSGSGAILTAASSGSGIGSDILGYADDNFGDSDDESGQAESGSAISGDYDIAVEVDPAKFDLARENGKARADGMKIEEFSKKGKGDGRISPSAMKAILMAIKRVQGLLGFTIEKTNEREAEEISK